MINYLDSNGKYIFQSWEYDYSRRIIYGEWKFKKVTRFLTIDKIAEAINEEIMSIVNEFDNFLIPRTIESGVIANYHKLNDVTATRHGSYKVSNITLPFNWNGNLNNTLSKQPLKYSSKADYSYFERIQISFNIKEIAQDNVQINTPKSQYLLSELQHNTPIYFWFYNHYPKSKKIDLTRENYTLSLRIFTYSDIWFKLSKNQDSEETCRFQNYYKKYGKLLSNGLLNLSELMKSEIIIEPSCKYSTSSFPTKNGFK